MNDGAYAVLLVSSLQEMMVISDIYNERWDSWVTKPKFLSDQNNYQLSITSV